mmetsp:Transcript_12978/g.21269  ORF Transcript_12978/g.21269 Transcript_12978/m.21269 type:complete len:86 (+) Transcript_12978:223-480(+)
MDFKPDERPAQPSLGRRVENNELKTSEASFRSSSISCWSFSCFWRDVDSAVGAADISDVLLFMIYILYNYVVYIDQQSRGAVKSG